MWDLPARRPWPALAIAFVATLGAVAGVLKVEPEVDFVDTVPASQSVDAYRDMVASLDGIRFVAIYMPSNGPDLRGDGFDALIQEQGDLTAFLEARFPGAFSHQLSAWEAMRSGNYMLEKIATAGNPRAEAYSFPDDPVRYEAVKSQALGDDTLDDVLAVDGSSALMLFFFATPDNLEARHLTRDIADALDAWTGHQVTDLPQASGLLYSSQYTDERNGQDMRNWGLVALGAAGLVMLWVLRRPVHVAIAVTGMAVATLWAFGLTGWLGIRVSFLTLFLAPVVMGIGIDAAVHLLHRTQESRDAGAAAKATGPAILAAGITTAAGLAVLAFVPNPLFAEIGAIAALGIVMSLLATYLVVLPLAKLLPVPEPGRGKGIRWAAKPRWMALVLVAILTGVAGVVATQTSVESGNAQSEFPADDPVILLQQRIESEYGSFQRAYIVVRGDMTDPVAIAQIHQSVQDAASLPLFRDASSIADILLADEATDQGALDIALAGILGPTPAAPTEASRLPQTQQEARDRLDQVFADPLWRTIAPFTITRDYDLAVVAITVDPWSNAAELRDLRDALQAQATNLQERLAGHDVDAAGAPLNRAAVIDQTPTNLAIATLGTALVVTVILAVAWNGRGWEGRRIALAAGGMVLIAALWLLAAVVALDAIHQWVGTGNRAALTDTFLLAFAITVAIGVDDLVHIVNRTWQARDAGHPAPLSDAFEHAGRAITGTSATTMVAFAVLAGVYFLQSKNLAILTAVGAASAYGLTLALAPWLLRKHQALRPES
ncbi:MAG: efflux RND transporter permease subunit [Thermoplasmatota archaeon]